MLQAMLPWVIVECQGWALWAEFVLSRALGQLCGNMLHRVDTELQAWSGTGFVGQQNFRHALNSWPCSLLTNACLVCVHPLT